MNKLVILLCFTSVMSCAAITDVQTRTSPQQIVVTFTAGYNPPACTLALSENASLTPIVRDLDTTLFAGANLASRAGNLVSGNAVTFIAGQRGMTNGLGLDGNWYSRSLQVDTLYYGKITCGSDTATFTAHTAPLPAGMTHQDSLPAHWPTIQSEISCVGWGGRCPRNTEQIIDPQTGVLATHVDMASDFGYRETAVRFGYA